MRLCVLRRHETCCKALLRANHSGIPGCDGCDDLCNFEHGRIENVIEVANTSSSLLLFFPRVSCAHTDRQHLEDLELTIQKRRTYEHHDEDFRHSFQVVGILSNTTHLFDHVCLAFVYGADRERFANLSAIFEDSLIQPRTQPDEALKATTRSNPVHSSMVFTFKQYVSMAFRWLTKRSRFCW